MVCVIDKVGTPNRFDLMYRSLSFQIWSNVYHYSHILPILAAQYSPIYGQNGPFLTVFSPCLTTFSPPITPQGSQNTLTIKETAFEKSIFSTYDRFFSIFAHDFTEVRASLYYVLMLVKNTLSSPCV